MHNIYIYIYIIHVCIYLFIIIIIITITITIITRPPYSSCSGATSASPPRPPPARPPGACKDSYEEFTRLAETRLAQNILNRI